MTRKDPGVFEFLPAALEMQEVPPNPLSRTLIRVIVCIFIVASVWAWQGRVDVFTTAQGKLVPNGNIKLVQPATPGIVRRIHVDEGDRVVTGDLLVELDDTTIVAERNRLQSEYTMLLLDKLRLRAQLSWLDAQGRLAPEFVGNAVSASAAQITLQLAQFEQWQHAYQAEQRAWQAKIVEQEAERDVTVARIQQLQAILPLTSEKASALYALMRDGMASRAQWLEFEQLRIKRTHELQVQRRQQQRLTAALANTQATAAAWGAQHRQRILAALTENRRQVSRVNEQIIEAEQGVAAQTLTAPTTGFVHQLAIHTVGGVVTAAQVLMQIVPDQKPLEVQAWLLNKDIGFVFEGQPVTAKIETFPFTKYGVVSGTLRRVSADAVYKENLGLMYTARVELAARSMRVGEKFVRLLPGMTVTIEIGLGRRRIIEYLLSPLLRYASEGMHER